MIKTKPAPSLCLLLTRLRGGGIGSYAYGTIPAFGTAVIPEADIERELSWVPTQSQLHVNIQTTLEASDDDGMTTSPYRVKHLVQNGANGAYADMTEVCSGIAYTD
jgi:hypothetical protein